MFECNFVNTLKECLNTNPEVHLVHNTNPEVHLVHNGMYWAAILMNLITHWADLSRKECNKRILGRFLSQIDYFF